MLQSSYSIFIIWKGIIRESMKNHNISEQNLCRYFSIVIFIRTLYGISIKTHNLSLIVGGFDISFWLNIMYIFRKLKILSAKSQGELYPMQEASRFSALQCSVMHYAL